MKELNNEEILAVIELEKKLNKDNKYANHRLLPFPHLRYNYTNIARDLLPIQELPTGALPLYERKNNEHE